MEIKTVEGTQTFVHSQKVESIYIGDSLFLTRRVDAVIQTSATGRSSKSKKNDYVNDQQGFVSASNLTNMQKGLKFKFQEDYGLMTDEAVDDLRCRGWVALYEKPLGVYQDRLFERYIESKGELNIVRFDGSNHHVYDANGEHLPVGQYLDYIDFSLRDNTYDLSKAWEILNARDDVTVMSTTDYGRTPNFNRPARKVQEAIVKIPYYNNETGSEMCMYVMWQPNAEVYAQVQAECGKIGGSYPSTNRYQAMWNLDVMGLRAGGAALCDDFYGRVEYPESDDDDDDDDDDDY